MTFLLINMQESVPYVDIKDTSKDVKEKKEGKLAKFTKLFSKSKEPSATPTSPSAVWILCSLTAIIYAPRPRQLP
jgi:hypothetical protein